MIPKIMDDTKSLTELVLDDTCIGRLPEAISCVCHEVLWGENVATIVIPKTARYFGELHEGGILKIRQNDFLGNQLFRISKIGKVMSNGNVTVYCEHISYDTKKVAVLPFSGIGISNVLSQLTLHIANQTPFKLYTDMANDYSQVTFTVPTPLREVLGGTEGSIRDIFSGPGGICELLCDNLNIYILKHRGNNTGVTIEYGKNLLELTHEHDISEVYDAVLGYATTQEGRAIIGDLYLLSSTQYQRVKIVDLTDKLAEGQTPNKTIVNTLTQQYVAQNDVGTPSITINVSFQSLKRTEQYELIKQLEQINLGDYVNVRVSDIGVNTMAEVIEVQYDTLAEEYTSMILGNTINNLPTTISKNVTQAQASTMVASLAKKLTSEDIFNRLTNNGQQEGIYMSDGHLYINLTYARAGTLALGGLNNTNGLLEVYNASGVKVGTLNNKGLTINNASSKNKVVLDSGQLSLYSTGSGSTYGNRSWITATSYYGDLEINTASNGSIYLQVMNNSGGQQSQAIVYSQGMSVTGKFSSTGTKSRLVDTEGYGDRLLYCYEMPSPMFGDIGEGETDEYGECIIDIDDIFGETISTWTEYQVFIQPEGEGSLYVDQKERNFFVVRGTKNLRFAWELKAKQRDYEYERIEENELPEAEEDVSLILEDEMDTLFSELEDTLYETAE